tara:strand:+ start:218 stop:1231 length:1014 start_codon:yes stop_codon:yes gene_type:complete
MKFERKKKTSLADLVIGVEKEPEPVIAVKEVDDSVGLAKSFKKDFCNWLETGYSRIFETRSPGRHASSLWKTCGRRTVLEALMGFEKVPEQISAGAFMTQDEGHALHHWWQNEYLPGWGKLKGQWICVRCNTMVGSATNLITKPTECLIPSCPSRGHGCKPSFEYVELKIKVPKLNLVGSVDAILDYKGKDYVGELKTKSVSQFKMLHAPEYGHIIQAHAYMKGSNTDCAIFIYVQKGKMATWSRPKGVWKCTGATLKVFFIPFDQELWDRVTMLIGEDDKAIELVDRRGLYEPDVRLEDNEDAVEQFVRACGSRSCELAKQCPVREQCFAIAPVEV